MKLLLALAALGTVTLAQSNIPDLAKLKLAAEVGDAVAQYEYGTKISFTNHEGSFAMILKSANQGYGPAEESIGARYLEKYTSKTEERAKFQRLAVRYTSRAAFKGFAAAQARLSYC